MRFLAAIQPQHPQRNPRLQRASRASVVFLLVPPSESRSPPALITVRIERASHRSSSSELLIFPLRSRARILGLISRGENDAYVVIRRNCWRGYRKLTTSRPPVNGELGELRGSRTVSSSGWDRPIKSRVGEEIKLLEARHRIPSFAFRVLSRIEMKLSSPLVAPPTSRYDPPIMQIAGSEGEKARVSATRFQASARHAAFSLFRWNTVVRRIMAACTYTSQCDF